MQPFIMAMLKLHSSIDFVAAVDPQVHEEKTSQSEDSQIILHLILKMILLSHYTAYETFFEE